jgi:hypothetical protein
MKSYKDSYSVEIKPVNNGFFIEESWQEPRGDKEFTDYKCEKYIFSRWAEAAQFLEERFN